MLVLDSGVGGLGVVAELRALRPGLPIAYLADTAGFPYGERAPEDLVRHLVALLSRAIAAVAPRLVVLACNTASVVALAALRARFDLPFVGCVPAIKWAASLSRTRCFGLLATPATAAGPAVADLVARFAPDCTVHAHGARHLAGLAERRFLGTPPPPGTVAAELDGLLSQPGAGRIDTIVLGCTHYRLLLPELARAAPPGLTWLDPAPAVARRVSFLLDATPCPALPRLPRVNAVAFVTAPPDRPHELARRLLAFGFASLRLLDTATPSRPVFAP